MNSFSLQTQWLWLVLFVLGAPTVADAQVRPKVLDAGYELIEFASNPDIVTPIGATFDAKGRLLVIESHTHQTPEAYEGPTKDRIRIVEDTDGDGRADRFRTFFEGTTHTMSLRQGADGWLYVATRAKVFRIRDTDDDDKADEEQVLVRLETNGTYPHNGLSGLALDGNGYLYFGMGENLGESYRMIGSDNRAQHGSGEGGVFRSKLDGKGLRRIATGFWNPFGICFDPHGRMFAVGNDADGRPPCRLVQIADTGDYGFQFKYGRSGRHPLQAWNGELPGTLPMAAATGEAPCEIVAHQGQLWVAIWGDYRIERYTITLDGARVKAERDVVVQGDSSFRPVAMAKSPDGSLYVTDWVNKSYPVHGKGRIWRLRRKVVGNVDGQVESTSSNPQFPELTVAELQARRAASGDQAMVLQCALTDDVFLRQAAVAGIANTQDHSKELLNKLAADARGRLVLLQALRWATDHAASKPGKPPVETLRDAIRDNDKNVRLYGVRWAADHQVQGLGDEFREQLKRVDITPQLFLATIGAQDWIETKSVDQASVKRLEFLRQSLADTTLPVIVREMALRLLPVDDEPSLPFVQKLADGEGGERLQREAVRTIVQMKPGEGYKMFGRTAKRSEQADADIMLLADDRPESKMAIVEWLGGGRAAVMNEVRRQLMHKQAVKFKHPDSNDKDAWLQIVGTGGDADAGWRVFFSKPARCSECHQYQGRGSRLGPELTGIAKRTSRADVLESLLHPNRDIAPMFVTTVIETKDGRTLEGLQQDNEVYLKSDGSRFKIGVDAIQSRRMSKVSMMPSDLHQLLSAEELRNLLALLEQ